MVAYTAVRSWGSAGQDWRRNTKANTACLLAIMMVPIAATMGLAIDSARKANAVRHVQMALDAASLAGVLAMEDAGKSDADVQAISSKVFAANISTSQDDLSCEDPAVLIDRLRVTVRATANCRFAAMIGGGITAENVYVKDVAEARARTEKIDLSLILDTSGSMRGEKIRYLKQAANQTVTSLLNTSAEERVRIALVSFSTAVNAGIYGNEAQGLPVLDDEDGDGVEKVCVTERAGDEALTDEEPGPFKWVGNASSACPRTSIVPLTDSVSELTTSINSMSAGGATAGTIALAWSWYLISPKWNDIWPASSRPHPYEGDALKVVILMSDGNFNASYITGSASRLGRDLCEAMRGSKVIVYAIAFDAPARAQRLLKNCTGDNDERYFEAETGEDLLNAYSAIAAQLSTLTLSE